MKDILPCSLAFIIVLDFSVSKVMLWFFWFFLGDRSAKIDKYGMPGQPIVPVAKYEQALTQNEKWRHHSLATEESELTNLLNIMMNFTFW